MRHLACALSLVLIPPCTDLFADERLAQSAATENHATENHATENADAENHAKEVESWRLERLEGLRQPDSWLTLVGLFWLEEGENVAGGDLESKVVFPPSTAARLGVFHLSGTQVKFLPATGSKVQAGDQPVVGSILLQADTQGEATVLGFGSISFYVIERGGRYGVRIKDRENAAYRDFKGLDYFPIQPDWRLDARFENYDPPRTLEIPTVLGTVSQVESPGAVVLQIAGREYRLEALPGGDESEIWLIFGDATNAHETYGGGRFLYAQLTDADRAIVDFNKAYSPPCVFSPYATCPLPPKENRLDVAITAGEKTYGEH